MKVFCFTVSFLIIVAGLLSACDREETIYPTQLVPVERMTATDISAIKTTTPTSTSVPLTPGLTPAFVYAPDVGKSVYPLASLRILTPGDGSRLTSPIFPKLSILLGVDDTVEVELVNSKGELLVKKLLRYPEVDSNLRILIQPEMDFEITGNEEAGRLIVRTRDAYGRLISLASCELTLLSVGESTLEAAMIPYESFLLTEPTSGDIVVSGVVNVAGYARLVDSSVIVIELVDENGMEISNRVLTLSGDPGGAPIVFTATLPYHVERETSVRLILRQARGIIPGAAIASSLLLNIR
jgi:hypothetical protein